MTLHKFLSTLAAVGLYTPPETMPRTTNGHPAGPPPAPGDPTATRYCWAALVGECATVAATAEGRRNHELNRSAYRMGQLVGAGYLDEQDAEDALLDAAHLCGLPDGEALATIGSGLSAGRSTPRHLALRAGIAPAYTVSDTDLSAPVRTQVSAQMESDAGTAGGQAGTAPGQPGTTGDDPADDGLPVPVDWHQAWGHAQVDPDWLVPDILERGRSHVLYAPHKIGKSLLTQTLCAQLASQRVSVLYVDLENSLADVVERLQDMGHGPDDLDTLHYLSFPSMAALDTFLGGATLLALVQKYAADLVVLDTTSRVISGEENSADTFRALYRHALVPLKAAGVTVLRIDHAGKDITAGQRGSSAKGDDVDTAWLLTRRDDTHYQLLCTAQRSGHHPQTIELLRRDGPLEFERIDENDPFSRPEVTVCVDQLDRLRVPASAGRDVARASLTRAGIRVQNSVLAAAVKIRKTSIECSKNLSGTGGQVFDLEVIDKTCPQDQIEFDEIPDETCPGQVADSADRSSGVLRAGPVRDPVRPKGGQVAGTARTWPGQQSPADPSEDQLIDHLDDRLFCERCRRPASRLIGPTHGRQLCPACAYPDSPTRPTDDEE